VIELADTLSVKPAGMAGRVNVLVKDRLGQADG
jgi:hypothetical protein